MEMRIPSLYRPQLALLAVGTPRLKSGRGAAACLHDSRGRETVLGRAYIPSNLGAEHEQLHW